MLVPDNLKAAVIKTDKYEPSLNRVLEDMGNHYGTVVVPAHPVHPKDKSNVEGNVRPSYMRVFAELSNEIFYPIVMPLPPRRCTSIIKSVCRRPRTPVRNASLP